MQLKTIDRETEDTFFRCLHDEKPADPRLMAMRRDWYERFKGKGLRAKVLLNDDKVIVGLCQYMPIEHSHILGEGLMVILCMWIHGYAHLIGNQQKKGYGRFMLEQIEDDAMESGFAGIAAWGMDFPYWNPVSFYEHMGYERIDEDQPVILVWKSFAPNAIPPKLLKSRRSLPRGIDKVNLVAFRNSWCNGCGSILVCRDTIEGMDDMVNYSEIDTSDKDTREFYGVDNLVMLDGEVYRPYEPPWNSEQLRQSIIEQYNSKSV